MTDAPNEPLRVLLVDDEQLARERLRELLQDAREELATTIVAEAASGPQALALLPECAVDVALVDIHMPAMNGIEFARHLQGLERPPAVIFITAHDQYALQAFEVNAIDYLLKPVRRTRLVPALRKAALVRGQPVADARERLARADRGPRRYLSAAERGRVTLIPVEDVIFLRAEQKYVVARTAERDHLLEESLSQLEQELGEQMVRVHRNCLVARRAIRGAVQTRGDAPLKDNGAREAGESGEEGDLRWAVVLEGVAEPVAVSRRQWASVKALVKG